MEKDTAMMMGRTMEHLAQAVGYLGIALQCYSVGPLGPTRRALDSAGIAIGEANGSLRDLAVQLAQERAR